MGPYSRREFFRKSVSLGAASILAGGTAAETSAGTERGPATLPRVVASANGLKATAKAMDLLRSGALPLDAVIAGVNIVEDDPNDMSVGYGGLPNENGIVELDASVMCGRTHASGAVAALRNIKNPSRVAKLVMERTTHCLLVGTGALEFALAHGFREENLLTDRAREAWLKWKESVSDGDNWLPPSADETTAGLGPFLTTYGTINCLAIDGAGDLAGVTTTSGLSYKLSGRVGDSPIIGAGLYVDNAVGAAGSTGLGEANIRTCASFQVVNFMGLGMSPEQACLKTLEKVSEKAALWPRNLRLCDADGRPSFGLNFYAINKKGESGAASMWSGSRYAASDGAETRLLECAYLYKRKPA
jgi:N4-(beta-N-acetylglucosaminyl)-L-asparaginase